LAPRLREQQITMSKFFPSTFRSWLATLSPDDRFPSMRLIQLGGETVYGSDVERYRRFFTPDSLLINSYGSSETGSVSNYFVDRDIGGSTAVPAGFPIPGKEVSIVDEKGNELPPGEIGEIVVKSNFLSNGYWRRPDLTIEKFRDANGGKMKL